jgi:hypothetical protein
MSFRNLFLVIIIKKSTFASMKSYAASLLLAFFLLTTFVPSVVWQAFGQLAALKTHFEEHQKEDATLTFFAFLTLHYGADFKKHASKHDHSKLPLKHSTPSVSTTIVSVPPVETWFFNTISPHFIVEKHRSNFYFSQSFASQELTTIWQPPRV